MHHRRSYKHWRRDIRHSNPRCSLKLLLLLCGNIADHQQLQTFKHLSTSTGRSLQRCADSRIDVSDCVQHDKRRNTERSYRVVMPARREASSPPIRTSEHRSESSSDRREGRCMAQAHYEWDELADSN